MPMVLSAGLLLVAAASAALGQGILVDMDKLNNREAVRKGASIKGKDLYKDGEKEQNYIYIPAMIPESWNNGYPLRGANLEYPGMIPSGSPSEEVKELRRLNALLHAKVAQLEKEIADLKKK